MNQILITGDERVVEKVKKQKRPMPTNKIVMFYAISIIILGICLISGSVYAKGKINAVVEANMKPTVNIVRNDENNTLEVNVNHIRQIKTITYKWNEEPENVIEKINKKDVLEIIDLIGGTNTLTISITEENGESITYKNEFNVDIPEIKLEAVSNGVKLISKCKRNIDYIEYSWDDNEAEKIEVDDKKYEGIINAPKGEHILKIEVVDINGITAEKEQKVVGDTEPVINIEVKEIDGKKVFAIDAEDDEKIKTVEITHNSGEKKEITVDDKKYNTEIVMTEGEINTLIITVTNLNDLSKTRRVKFDNK